MLLAVMLCGCNSSSLNTNSVIENDGIINSEKGKDNADTEHNNFSEKSSDTNKEKEVVVFEDSNFERYIRSYLGKSSGEKLRTDELAKITELVIDRRFVEIDNNLVSNQLLTLLRIDLTDLKYFPNLTKLDIQNSIGDYLYSIDAIGYCSKLTELSFCYNFTSDHKNKQASTKNFYADVRGYKTLYTILKKLPELKKLDLGYALQDSMIQEIQEKAPNVMIVNDQEYENITHIKYINSTVSVIELDSLPIDTTTINMLLDDGEDINEAMKKVAAFENLNILRMFTKDTNVVIVNMDALAEHSKLEELVISVGTKSGMVAIGNAVLEGKALETIPNLKHLTLNNLVIADQDISNLNKLESINLNAFQIDGLSFLSTYTNLYQLKLGFFSIKSEDESKIIDSIKQGMKKQKNDEKI